MDIKELNDKITIDFAVELNDEFDRNYRNKTFFTEKWPVTKINNKKGSLMFRTGNLKNSIIYKVRENMILFSSSLPYASIHNEGGEIEVTPKMKKYFWAMYYKSSNSISIKKDGSKSNSKRNLELNNESLKWKGLALMKIGQKIKIQKRQMVGDHPQVGKIAKAVIDDNMEKFNQEMIKKFK